MTAQKLLTIFFIISLSLNVYFAAQFILLKMDLKNTAEQLRVQQSDEKALAFMNLFVNKILLAEGEVNFEDRLKLENAVRELNDAEVFSHWQNFTNGANESAAQYEVGKIFSLLLKKIYR